MDRAFVNASAACNLHSENGSDDEVTEREVGAWQQETTQPISLHTFPGGHFFIFSNALAVARLWSDSAVPHTRE
jgi:surfactin synthase thioesterase subunit